MDKDQIESGGRYALYILAGAFGALWVFADIFGQLAPKGMPTLMNNALCYQYLGCNIGFFGYDAFVHFILGIFVLFGILEIMHRRFRMNLLRASLVKNFFIVLSLVTLVSFAWEMTEYLTDVFRVSFLHLDLMHPIDHLSQPSNDDTMGDVFFSLIGTAITYIVLACVDPKSVRSGDLS